MAAYDVESRSLVASLAGDTGLATLLLRIYDHQRHTYQWSRVKRPDVGCVFPSVRQVAKVRGTSEFNIYDLLKFTHSGAGLTQQGCVNDICDAHQVHLIGQQWDFPNPWTPSVPADSSITPYHYWAAAAEVKAWRVANGGLPDNTKPLLATQVGIDYLSQPAGSRTDLTQLRRLKSGKLVLDALAYGCSLVSFEALGNADVPGFDMIDTTVAAGLSFIGAGAVAGSAANTAPTPLLPAGIEVDDLLLCISYTRTATGSHTSSWVTHASIDTGPHYLLVSYKIAAGSGLDAPPVITPIGVAADQSNLAVVMAFRGVDRTTPFDAPGANSTNAVAEDIGPIAAATALATDGAAIVVGVRNATSAGGNVSVLSGDGLTWVEAADGGFTTGFGCQMAVDYAIWSGPAPTLTAKTFDVATGLTGAGCGKMLLLRPAGGSAFLGSQGERDADYAFQALDMRETTDDISFVAKQWQDYWKGWQVSFDAAQTPIAGDASVCPWVEWNRVSMSGATVTMAAGGRNELRRKKNLGRGAHTFSCEVKLSAAGSQAALRVSGYDKLNGLAVATSSVLSGINDWTLLQVSFTPRQHKNSRISDPAVAVLRIDHNGVGICELRSPRIDMPGKPVIPQPYPYFDLRVTDISWSPENPVENEQVTFSATIKNDGNAPTPGGVIHGIRFDVDGVTRAWSDNNTTSLAAGASRVQSANNGPGGLSTWTAVLGQHTALAYVDDVNRMPTETDKTNNSFVETVSVAAAPPPGITPPAAAAAAGLTALFFNDEFNTISLYNPVSNPTGIWRMNEWYMDAQSAGYVAFGNNRNFNINQTTTDAAIAATMQPYFPITQPEPSVMRLTSRRARNNAGTWLLSPAMNTLTNNIAVAQDPALNNMVKWLSVQLTTTHFFGDSALDYSRPAYIEGRIRWTPVTNGIGCGFWQYAASNNSPARDEIEIDTFETNNLVPTNFHTNIHESASVGVQASVEHARTWCDGNWHIIALHWDALFLKVYWENVLLTTFSEAQATVFDEPMRMIIGVGGPPAYAEEYPSLIPLDSVTEIRMDLDWVRVWRPGSSTVNVFPATGTLATAYTVTAGGQDSPVYPVTINTWYRNNPNTTPPGGTEQEQWDAMEAVNETAGFTAFELSGASAPVSVRFNDRTVTSAKVYPVRHGITPTISGGNTVNFNVTKQGKYIVMVNNTEVRPCHVFVHPVDPTAPTASGPSVVYYGPGTHNIGTVTVANNTTYYVAGGARVVGQFNCGARSGFKIKGRGVVQSSGNFLVGDNASGFEIEGITILRPLGSTSDWTFKQRSATNFTVDGVNVFTCEVTRDGIDSVSCRSYTIRNCFARSLDDPCCINAAFSGFGNIDGALLEDCVFMPDNGIGGLEIGASMECTLAQNITYRRIDMVNPRIQCAISILNSDWADCNNIIYDDIHIDGFKGSVAVGSCFIGRFENRQTGFSALPYAPGQIRNIDLYNVTVINTAASLCNFKYQGNSTYTTGPVRWHNLNVNGTLITSGSQITVNMTPTPSTVGTITYDTTVFEIVPPSVIPSNSELIYQDEMDKATGSGWDATKWVQAWFMTQAATNHKNNTWYDNALVFHDGQGNLVMRCELRDGEIWTSWIQSALTQPDPNGWNAPIYVEIMADFTELAQSYGIWFALWMLGNGGGPDPYRELDFLEYPVGQNLTSTVNAAKHWGGNNAGRFFNALTEEGIDVRTGFHRYGCKWEANSFKAYIDDNEVYSTDLNGITDGWQYIVMSFESVDLNVEANRGIWGQLASDAPQLHASTFPVDVLIKYVRVWRL